jgi:DnaK suppressor protein
VNVTATSEKLAEALRKTEKSIATCKELSQPISPDCTIGRITRMDAINNKTIYENALRKAEDKHNKLLFLMDQAGKEDFGLCRKCKHPIPLERILITPESFFCVKCAV